MARLLRRAPLGLLLPPLVLATTPAHAGDRLGTDLSAGYSFAKIDDVSRHGGNAALGFHLAGPLSGFVDLSGHWGTDAGLDRSDLTLMAGPGLRFGRRGGTVLFVRALGGLVRERASLGVLDVELSESSRRFGVMGGGGIDLRVAERWAARLQGDYLWNDAKDGGKKSGFRASAGVVYRFGAMP